MGVWTTTVKDWADGTTPSAADFDAQLRDFANSFGAGTNYTPTLGASTTNPTLGTGSVAAGRYWRVQKTVWGKFYIQFGSSGVAAGSGSYNISIPVTPETTFGGGASKTLLGMVELIDSSANAMAMVKFELASTTAGVLLYPATWPSGTVTNVGAAAPWTWAANDQLKGWFCYEAA